MKNRSLNELRQTRDAVYVAPLSYEERTDDCKVGLGYLIVDAKGAPCVSCDDIACVVDARPTLSFDELEAHFVKGEGAYFLPNGEVIRTISRMMR